MVAVRGVPASFFSKKKKKRMVKSGEPGEWMSDRNMCGKKKKRIHSVEAYPLPTVECPMSIRSKKQRSVTPIPVVVVSTE